MSTTATPPTAVLESFNPSTGESVGSVPVTPVGEVDAIIARARLASGPWAALSALQRADILRPAAKVFAERAEEMGLLLTREQGKPLAEGIGEVRACGAILDSDLDEIVNAIQPEVLKDDGVQSSIHFDPYGVCATITPWNYPILMPHNTVVPALVAGNTVVLKPSEQTPLIAEAYVEVLNEFLPEGVLQIIHGEDDQGKALVAGDVDLIAFTGSKTAGQHIMGSAAKGLKRVILELGSKDPCIVLEGADLEKAAAFAARNSFRNAGQVCVSTERIYVQDSIKDQFLAKLTEEAKNFPIGDGQEESTAIGPMVMHEQKTHVLRQVADAKAKGARVVVGGNEHPGNFVEPTILDGVNHTMDIMTVETFGPIACVQSVRDGDEAVALANDTEYGLGAVIFGDEETARKLSRKLTAGMIGVNRSIGGASGMPWVGARQSGYSYHSGPHGHRQFCQLRVVSTNEE